MIRPFKIAAAQINTLAGDIDENLKRHLVAIDVAIKRSVSAIVFPELSLIGYEPQLAAELAMNANDARFDPLRLRAKDYQIEISLGVPLANPNGKPGLGAIIISSDGSSHTYHKMHLVGSEPQFFQPGTINCSWDVQGTSIGVAICADASQESHPENYAQSGSQIYAASVFLTSEWYETDCPRLAAYSSRFEMLVLMANHAKTIGTYSSVGKSAAWAPDGRLLAQALGTEECLVIAARHGTQWSAAIEQFG